MTRLMKHIVYICCLVLAKVMPLLAQNPSPEVVFWTRTLREESPKRIVELLGDPAKPAWPSIRTAHWIEKLPAADRLTYQGRDELAKALLSKLKQGFPLETPATLVEIDSEKGRYLAAASRIAAADGYANRLLEDCIYRMLLFRFSGWLVKHPDAFDEISARAKAAPVPQPDVSGMLLRFRVEDPELDKLAIDMAAIDPAKSVLHQIHSTGVPDAVGWKILMEPAASYTTTLISNPSVILLLGRMAFTEKYHQGLLGMAEYLRRGGKMDAQSINTASEFHRIMGKADSVYGGRLMEGSLMGMGTLQNFVEVHSPGTPARKLFVEQLFE